MCEREYGGEYYLGSCTAYMFHIYIYWFGHSVISSSPPFSWTKCRFSYIHYIIPLNTSSIYYFMAVSSLYFSLKKSSLCSIFLKLFLDTKLLTFRIFFLSKTEIKKNKFHKNLLLKSLKDAKLNIYSVLFFRSWKKID